MQPENLQKWAFGKNLQESIVWCSQDAKLISFWHSNENCSINVQVNTNLSACCYDDMKNLEASSEFDYKN